MPTSEQDVSMRDLLASCAAASAVSTPPREAGAEAGADAAPTVPVRDAQDADTAEDRAPRAAPERRRAA
jgi:hypothetical protein